MLRNLLCHLINFLKFAIKFFIIKIKSKKNMKSKSFITVLFLLIQISFFGQRIFKTNENLLSIKVNNKIVSNFNWSINLKLKPDVFEFVCDKKVNSVTFFDNKDSINFKVRLGDKIDFIVLLNQKDTAHTQISGIESNIKFTKSYIKKHQGKTFVEIPEVSELVNIIMALHKDAEKENNMFDTKSDYYNKVKTYFENYKNHPIIDTIQKHISGLHFLKEQNMSLFSNESYGYYYALKMNACSYEFDKNCKIKNKGFIKEMANGWYKFDPMKDLKLIEDFAKKSNFRNFYKENKNYYESLITTYNQLNPIQKMQTWLDKKFGFGYGSYVIYFSPLIYGAHSTQGFEKGNFKQSFMFVQKAEINKNQSLVMNELSASRGLFTEIDHNYVNPVTDKFIEKVNSAFSNREKWAKGKVSSGYKNEYMVFNEYMTWAVYTLYIYDNYSKDDLMSFLPKMENQMKDGRGFIKFEDFNRTLLEKYKQNTNIKITDLYDFILDWSSKENTN